MKPYEVNVEERLACYKKVLSGSPGCLRAVERVEQERDWPSDTRLYLHTMAPVLLYFVLWTMNQAIALGRKRLYFLSRDGYQMYRVALTLTKQHQLPIECRYLCVSRYSIRMAEYSVRPEGCLDKICMGGIDVTLEKILRRAALTGEECEEIISGMGWQERREDILNYRQILEVKRWLEKQPKLFRYVREHSKTAYENTVAYLEQEGLFSDVPYGIVDSGWIGTLQESIETLVRSRKKNIHIEGFYFGLYEVPGQTDPARYHAYYFAPGGQWKRKANFSNSLFETLCSADEGMTIGYEFQGGRIIPRKKPQGNPNGRQLRRNLSALDLFLEFYAECGEKVSGENTGKLAERLLIPFMAHPAFWEMKAYGDSLFSDDMLDENRKKVAAELTEEEIRNQRFVNKFCMIAGWKKGFVCESAWLEGSIVRCGRHRNSNLYHARLYKYFVYVKKDLKNGLRRRKRAE